MQERELRKIIEDFKNAEKVRNEGIARACRQGMRPVDLEAVTGYSREHVRRILRSEGIEGRRGKQDA